MENSPWAVICPRHGRVYMTREVYELQLRAHDSLWLCPQCGQESTFDDETWEASDDFVPDDWDWDDSDSH